MKFLTRRRLPASAHLACVTALLLGAFAPGAACANTDTLASVSASRQALRFEQNRGQFHESVDFVAHGKGYSVALGPWPVVELMRNNMAAGATPGDAAEAEPAHVARLHLKVLGAREGLQAKAQDRHPALTHYLLGSPAEWRTDVANFERVHYADILPLIDIEYYGQDGLLEYDFVVRPGGNPDAIRLSIEGAGRLRIDEQGNLLIRVGNRDIVQRAPLSFQLDENGERQVIPSAYTLDGNTVGFKVAQWDDSRALVIDPVLEYSAYFGGAKFDRGEGVELDAAGNIYVIGTSMNSGLATAGAYLESISGERIEEVSFPICDTCTDDPDPAGQVRRVRMAGATSLFVTKFSPDGQTLLWSTYVNGTPAQSISLGIDATGVSPSGEVAFGLSNVADGLPLLNPTQSWSAVEENAYVAKLNAAGNGLIFSTYLNLGNSGSWVRGLDVSATGQVAATGLLSDNSNFPVAVGIPGQNCALNTALFEFFEGYVALFDSTGALTFSSCLGGEVRDGSFVEALRGVAFGGNGDLYVVGYSSMLDFPVVNPIQATKNVAGAREMTISQIDPDTGTLVFSTWFGPTTGSLPPGVVGTFQQFFPLGIKVDSGDNIIVSGLINGLTYPLVNAFQTNLGVPRSSEQFRPASFENGAVDIVLTKLHPVNGVVFSTYLGGSQAEGGFPSLAIDNDDNIYAAVVTASDDYPVLNPIQATKGGDTSIALSKFTPGGALAFSTYLGGSDDAVLQVPGGVAVNDAGKIVLAGWTRSTDFPIVGSGTSSAGDYDATLAIIAPLGDADTDGDGVPDAVDAFPGDNSEWRDIDNDLTGDNADPDDDGDGVPDVSDRFPQDPGESADADEDGAGDNLDEFDFDSGNYFDLDGDSIADFADDDTDGDGVIAFDDQFDFDASETTDTDGDGIGDNADADDDGDGYADFQDLDPLDAQSPVHGYEGYDPFNVSDYLSPWPDGYIDVAGTDASWTSATDQARSGEYSFTSRTIADNEVAAIRYLASFAGGGVAFWYKVDSQPDSDVLTFSIDGAVELTVSGDSGWQRHATTLSSGPHTLEWRYTKDGSIAAGADAAWIDDLVFDSDGDSVTDDVDNCTLLANPLQRDTDGDGYGNFCDADLNNDCIVNAIDLGLFRAVFFGSDPDADLNGDGVVNPVDIGLFRLQFFGAPGPGPGGQCGAP